MNHLNIFSRVGTAAGRWGIVMLLLWDRHFQIFGVRSGGHPTAS